MLDVRFAQLEQAEMKPSHALAETAGRALRALAQAGSEVAMFAGFLILMLIGLLLFDRWVTPLPLVTFEGRIHSEYATHDSLRAQRIEARFLEALPEGSEFRISEESLDALDRKQKIVADVVLRNLSGLLQWSNLPDHLWYAESDSRSLQFEVISFSGPPGVIVLLSLQLVSIPWLLLRFRFLPADSPPARPAWNPQVSCRRILLLSLLGGLALGAILHSVFHFAVSSGLLTPSETIPNLQSMGMTTLPWVVFGAFALALGGFLEEAFFRGVLLRRFVQNGVSVFGVIVCAFWFSILHAGSTSLTSEDVAFLFSAGFGGLLFGWMALKFKSWIPAGLTHAGYNFSVTFTMLALS